MHTSRYNDNFSAGGIAPKIKNATLQGIMKIVIIACRIDDSLIIITVKPNHELQYNIGTDFCVEDPMSSKFHSIITCQLEGDALPTPEFLWNVTVNGTDSEVKFNLLSFERDFYYENDSLRFVGPINFDLTSTLSLDIECYVSNMFGNDTATTSISLCGKACITLSTGTTTFCIIILYAAVGFQNL